MPSVFHCCVGIRVLVTFLVGLAGWLEAKAVPTAPGGALGDRKPSADSLVIPFRTVAHDPMVEVQAVGRKWNFIVDTGSAICAGSAEFALASAGTTNARSRQEFIAADGQIISRPVVKAPLLRLGEKAFVNVPLAVIDFSDCGSAMGVPVDGVLGFQFFRRWRLTLDYAAGELRLNPTNLPAVTTGYHVPYVLREGTPYIKLRLQGRSLEFVLDTGNDGSLELPAEQLGLRLVFPSKVTGVHATISGIAPNREARLAGILQLGGIEFIEPVVTSMPENRFYVGGEILEHFTVTFDPYHQRVEFIPNEPGTVRLPSRRNTGVVFDRAAEPWRVMEVLPDSPEVTRQIRPGDQCIRLNGQPVSAWSADRYRSLIDRTDILQFTLIRDGKEFEVMVPIQIWVP